MRKVSKVLCFSAHKENMLVVEVMAKRFQVGVSAERVSFSRRRVFITVCFCGG